MGLTVIQRSNKVATWESPERSPSVRSSALRRECGTAATGATYGCFCGFSCATFVAVDYSSTPTVRTSSRHPTRDNALDPRRHSEEQQSCDVGIPQTKSERSFFRKSGSAAQPQQAQPTVAFVGSVAPLRGGGLLVHTYGQDFVPTPYKGQCPLTQVGSPRYSY